MMYGKPIQAKPESDDPTTMRRRTFLALLGAAGASAAAYPMLDEAIADEVVDQPTRAQTLIGRDAFIREDGVWRPIGGVEGASLYQPLIDITTVGDQYRRYMRPDYSELTLDLQHPDLDRLEKALGAREYLELNVSFAGYEISFQWVLLTALSPEICDDGIRLEVNMMVAGAGSVTLA